MDYSKEFSKLFLTNRPILLTVSLPMATYCNPSTQGDAMRLDTDTPGAFITRKGVV
jgi:hypothetical protein